MTSTQTPKKGFPLRLLVIVAMATIADALLSIQVAQWSYAWLPVPASTAAPYVDDLFSLEVGIGAFIFIGSVGFILWSVIFNRAEKYDESDGLPIEGNTRLEITWTVIPFVIVMALAFYSIQVNEKLASLGPKQKYDVAVNQAPDAVATVDARRDIGPIDVIARQWSWEFIYPDGVRSSELHLPINQRANFQLSSEDVLHGFYIPAFRLKQDIIPGSVISYSITPTREGRYRLRDSMFSGAYFSHNQTDVVVESEQAYNTWLKATAKRPLVQGLSPGTSLYAKRLKDGNRGWATVPPATPPMVNDPGNPDEPHDA
ncbi:MULTISPECIES: cytochrome c oxidase subunit II [unclassified Synechococcus]|uniref:cytochrome c oxidase subunit II n=1 Tax=unclassified Synechococcus TaxID=2626047 RepID=UPI0016440660|nr:MULTISPECIES: cytochrome c oxidase subunit II [unclassified Synechococcus]QNI47862.1 cytochrome c oxidase subunit II [Synechococcus sp. A15-60]